MSEWKEYKFSDLLEKVIDNRGKTCPVIDNGFPLIATNCIRNDKLYPDFINVRYVSEETYHSWFRGHPEPEDIIFVLKGTPGRVCWTPNPVSFCIAQDMVALRANRSIVNPKYLFAILRSSQIQQKIEALHVGSLIPHFKKGDFDKLFLPVPTNYKLQEEIGNIYFDFCDKIELNTAINKNLEAFAQALFKQWFVDFEFPNEEGLPYKSSGGEMVESELGMIPKGWRVGTLSDEFIMNMGQSPKGESYNVEGDGMIFFQGRSDFGFRFPSVRMFTTEPKKVARQFETLISVRAPVGDINMAHTDCCIGRGLGSINHPKMLHWYSYYKMLSIQNILKAYDNEGTVFGSINKESLGQIAIMIAPEDLTEHFNNIVSPIDNAILLNINESSAIKKLRDILLPLLINEKININLQI